MQLQDLSYKLNSDTIRIADGIGKIDYIASVEVFSLENVYTVPVGSYSFSGREYFSDVLVWGNTEKTDGSVRVSVNDCELGKTFDISARLDKPVRGVKLRLDGLPVGKLISLTDEDKDVTEYGSLYRYPEGWRSMSTALLVFELADSRYLYIRCLDKTVREKRFFVKKTSDGKMRVDIVQDCAGTELDVDFAAPRIECGIADSADEIYDLHSEYVRSAFGLDEFENSRIAPSWLKDIQLVVTMHMQSFTGYVFHTYESALRDVERLAKLIDGKHILVYLTGWEGRYYYKYGNYTADDRLGGAEALKATVDGMHLLGCKVMAMYGMNMANKTIPEIAGLVEASEFETVSGAKFRHRSVDWDGAHHYDFNDLAQLNIANKPWRDHLFASIKNATEAFGFDGAFLDIAACFVNDKNSDPYRGVVEFCDGLRTIKPDFLVSGEGYYDGLSRAMPLFQSGHTDGRLHYHDRVSERLFTRFSREFAHLCIGDLSRGSSGVHELGENSDRTTPLRKGIIPTVSLVEDTLEKAYDKVAEVIAAARNFYGSELSE